MKRINAQQNRKLFRCIGRTYEDVENNVLYFNWTLSGLEFMFEGSYLTATFRAESGEEIDGMIGDTNANRREVWPWIAVFVDDEKSPYTIFEVSKAEQTQLIFQGKSVEQHKIRIIKLTEHLKTIAGITEFCMEGELLPTECPKKKKIEFIGDSITCGFGNLSTDKDRFFYSDEENGWLSHAAIAARALHMEVMMTCISGITVGKRNKMPMPYVMNELYEYTDRIMQDRLSNKGNYEKWKFEDNTTDYVVLNLGTNDGTGVMLSGDKECEMASFEKDYDRFIRMIRRCNGEKTYIVCALGSMDYYLYDNILRVVSAYQKETGDSRICCFKYGKIGMLEGLGACGHPSVITHQRMADEMIALIQKLESEKIS